MMTLVCGLDLSWGQSDLSTAGVETQRRRGISRPSSTMSYNPYTPSPAPDAVLNQAPYVGHQEAMDRFAVCPLKYVLSSIFMEILGYNSGFGERHDADTSPESWTPTAESRHPPPRPSSHVSFYGKRGPIKNSVGVFSEDCAASLQDTFPARERCLCHFTGPALPSIRRRREGSYQLVVVRRR